MGSPGLTTSDRMLIYVVGALLVLVLGYQFSSLYYFPQYDGARAWGDEFGQIIELKHELEHGYAAIPTGKGATVAVTNGIVRGNSWLAAIVYGVPAMLFYPAFDLVTIGRTVTAVLSIVLLWVLFFALRKFGTSRLVSIAAPLVLVSNLSFVFASHSARLDVAAGLTVLGWTAYCVDRYRKMLAGTWLPSDRWLFGFSAVTFSLATFSIHLLTLLGPVAVFVLLTLGKKHRVRALGLGAAGVLAVAALLLGTYALSGAPITLFGETSHHIQSHDVLNAMPAFNPLSWSVQSSNLVQRFEQFTSEAIFIAVIFLTSLFLAAYRWKQLAPTTRFTFICCGIILVSWLQFQSSAVYYLLHVTPLMIFMSVMVARTLKLQRWKLTLALGSIALVYLHIVEVTAAEGSSEMIDSKNRAAVEFARQRLPDDDSEILVQYPAVALLHRSIGDRLMTTHFVNFPVDSSSVSEVLQRQNVSTMLLYGTSRIQNYSFEVAPLWDVVRSRGRIDTIVTGHLFDVALDRGDSGDSDTLYVVRLEP